MQILIYALSHGTHYRCARSYMLQPAETISATTARPSHDGQTQAVTPKQSVSGPAVPSVPRTYAAKAKRKISPKTPPPPSSVTITSATSSSIPHSTSASTSQPGTSQSTSVPQFGDAGLFGVGSSPLLSALVGMVCQFISRIQAPWAQHLHSLIKSTYTFLRMSTTSLST